MPSLRTLLRICAPLACYAGIASAQYTLTDNFDDTNFFQNFNFFSGADPTNGFVSFVDAGTANSTQLAGYSNNAVYMGVDSTTMNPAAGRASTRVTSNKAYNHGLFIADIAHMPGSTCGVWPAFWTFGPGWPGSGEIDIIEGVNAQNENAITLHTSSGCTMSTTGSGGGGVLANADCNSGNGNDGCSQSTTTSNNYGDGFNANQGGVYALDWTSSAISIYFFPRNSIPADITSGNPNPSSWGLPSAKFSGGGCNIDDHFKNHNIIFDTTFCGDWAGQVWSSGSCASKAATCTDYVAQNPSAFKDSYWLINSVKVYNQGFNMTRRDMTRVVPRPFLA
jgi:hypothetical protein